MTPTVFELIHALFETYEAERVIMTDEGVLFEKCYDGRDMIHTWDALKNDAAALDEQKAGKYVPSPIPRP